MGTYRLWVFSPILLLVTTLLAEDPSNETQRKKWWQLALVIGFAAGYLATIFWWDQMGMYYAACAILLICGVFCAIQTKGEKIEPILNDEEMNINIFNVMFRPVS